MKFQLLAFAILCLGVFAQEFDESYDDSEAKIKKAKVKCYLEYDTCVNKSTNQDSKWECYRTLEQCEMKVEAKFEATTTASPTTTPPPSEGYHHRHHGHHHGHHHGRHHGHRHHHHHRRHHMCPKHFCKCFEQLVSCIKKQHNKTMSNEEPAMPFMPAGSARYGKGDKPMPPMAELFFQLSNNGSKGNGTRVCFMKFKGCLRKRPRQEEHNKFNGEESYEMKDKEDENDEKSDDDKFELDDEYDSDKKMPWKTAAGKFKKFGKMYAKKFKGMRPSWSFTGAWGKLRNFGKTVVTKVKTTFGYGRRGPPRRRRPQHGPFSKCMFAARMCRWRAWGDKRKMKTCAKNFAKCILGICKRMKN